MHILLYYLLNKDRGFKLQNFRPFMRPEFYTQSYKSSSKNSVMRHNVANLSSDFTNNNFCFCKNIYSIEKSN